MLELGFLLGREVAVVDGVDDVVGGLVEEATHAEGLFLDLGNGGVGFGEL